MRRRRHRERAGESHETPQRLQLGNGKSNTAGEKSCGTLLQFEAVTRWSLAPLAGAVLLLHRLRLHTHRPAVPRWPGPGDGVLLGGKYCLEEYEFMPVSIMWLWFPVDL